MNFIGIFIAVLTLVVCIIGSLYARRAYHEMMDTYRRADLTGRFEPVYAGPTLHIVNHHRCEAKGIRIYLDESELAKHSAFPEQQKVREQIGPRGVHTYQLNVSHSTGYPGVIRITWNDKSGKPGEFIGEF